jgi:hypothetical protein
MTYWPCRNGLRKEVAKDMTGESFVWSKSNHGSDDVRKQRSRARAIKGSQLERADKTSAARYILRFRSEEQSREQATTEFVDARIVKGEVTERYLISTRLFDRQWYCTHTQVSETSAYEH